MNVVGCTLAGVTAQFVSIYGLEKALLMWFECSCNPGGYVDVHVTTGLGRLEGCTSAPATLEVVTTGPGMGSLIDLSPGLSLGAGDRPLFHLLLPATFL
jgi:hypothetical protein